MAPDARTSTTTPPKGGVSAYPRPQVEDMILAELAERRRARLQETELLRQALDRIRERDDRPPPDPLPLVDRRREISDLLFYLDAGYLELTVPDHRCKP